jgi:hypothetical protein
MEIVLVESKLNVQLYVHVFGRAVKHTQKKTYVTSQRDKGGSTFLSRGLLFPKRALLSGKFNLFACLPF